MVDYQTISIVLTGIGIIVSILYYTNILRNSEKTRRIQLVSRIREMRGSEEGNKIGIELLEMKWTDFNDFNAKYDSTVNPDNYAKRFNVWGQLQEIGYMLHEDVITIETIYNLLGGHNSLILWEKFKPIIYEQRRKYKDPSWFIYFEYLGEEIRKYRVKQGISSELTDADGYLTP